MANFSAKERMLAAVLSYTPGLKRIAKKMYVRFNAVLYKKKYKIRLLDQRIGKVENVENSQDEVFFGYYDKTCCWNDRVLFHRNSYPSTNIPDADKPVDLYVKDLNAGTCSKIDSSKAYNWQQGTRLHWISENEILYNRYNDASRSYEAVRYNVEQQKEQCTYPYPVQESFGESFFLSINYRRLWSMRPDYCYRCIPMMTVQELNDLDNDGIWYVDMTSGSARMLHSLAQIVKTDFRKQFDNSIHNANHVMLSPKGDKFIFIHRNYEKKRRFDRLLLSNFEKLKVIIDEGYVSHCCWIDNETIFGYLKANGEKGFFFINVETGSIKKCEKMTALMTGDGHPSFNGRFVAFDSYPDKSRMQKLFVYDVQNDRVFPLVELYQSTKYEEETRCDLHPRFSHDGNKLFFDTVYNGHRELCYIDLNALN